MSIGNSTLPKKCCLKCHFMERHFPQQSAGWLTLSVTEEERAQLQAGSLPPQVFSSVECALACYRGVWDHANLGKDVPSGLRSLLAQERGETCFFYPYTPGMFFPAARVLERRNADRREAEKDRKLTRNAFRVALIALIASILTTILTFIWNGCAHHHS